MKEIITIRQAERRDAEAIAKFHHVFLRAYEFDHVPVQTILKTDKPSRHEIKQNKNFIGDFSGMFLATLRPDSRQTINGSVNRYRIDAGKNENLVGVLQYDCRRTEGDGNIASVGRIMVLGDMFDGNNTELQKKSRQAELLNAFLKNKTVKNADAIAINTYFELAQNLQDIYGDLGKKSDAEYRLFKGEKDIQTLNDLTATTVAKTIYSV